MTKLTMDDIREQIRRGVTLTDALRREHPILRAGKKAAHLREIDAKGKGIDVEVAALELLVRIAPPGRDMSRERRRLERLENERQLLDARRRAIEQAE